MIGRLAAGNPPTLSLAFQWPCGETKTSCSENEEMPGSFGMRHALTAFVIVAAVNSISIPLHRTDAAEPIAETAGIRLGMTHAEVRSALAQIAPGMLIREYRASAPGIPQFVYALAGTHEPNGQSFDGHIERVNVMFSPVPGEDSAIAIVREVNFEISGGKDAPPVEDMLASLRTKFGQTPSDYFKELNTILWVFDDSGNIVKLPHNFNGVSGNGPHQNHTLYCATAGLFLLDQNPSPGVQQPAPDWSNRAIANRGEIKGCGTMIRVAFSKYASNQALAGGFIIGFVDVPNAVRATREADRISRENVAQREQQQIDQAHKKAPSIRY